ncbi:hypothetical protein [Paeniglutamicibacter sulfureus]|uniref:Uncharacterized protein n=1 Tax=Paeniglutamicibacter sulfureus TaxID=43666 RepID=A0ABU2BIS7_9MICC|nr:hypothetical protein [Paeniglutamicibacter sulfureus]MDR7358166.1 hypothetical protein [Paeniglutamicibacter sulfureus]
MKLPMSAPNIEAAMQKIYSVQPNRLFELMSAHPDDSRYMHWDELRYKTPPEAMTLEEWWLSLKFARRSQYRAVDLSDKNGQAFQFTMTDRLLKQSEQITRRASGQIRTPDDVFGTTVSIRRFGDHPLLPLGASDIAVGGQYLPGREPPVPNGPGYAWTAPVFSLML